MLVAAPGVFLLQEQCGQTSGESSGCKKVVLCCWAALLEQEARSIKQQGRDVAPEAAAVAFLLCWPKQITGASWNRNTLLSNLESWNNRIRQLIGFFSYPYGVGRGRKVAIVRILLLRRSSVPLWAALLGTCITKQSLLQCMGLH